MPPEYGSMMGTMNLYRLRRPVFLALSLLVVVGAVHVTLSDTWCPPEAPVHLEEAATVSVPLLDLVQGNLPPPMPNQLRAGKCDPDRAEEPIEGGCWIRTKTRPTCATGQPCACPTGKQWYYQGACYVPVMERASRPGVADP